MRKQKYIWKTEQVLCILLPCKTVQRMILSLRIGSREIYICLMKITKLYIRGYSPLFPNLITKKSYNWWVTRRVWGFRHKISKAKYLKMSVAHIWKLQENIAALCKIGFETLRISVIRRSGYVWPRKLKHPPLPSDVKHRMQNIRMECRRGRISDVRHLGGMSAEQKFQMWDIRVECRRSRLPDVRHPEKVALAGRNSYPGGMSYDSRSGGMSRIPYSLHSGFAYGKGLQSFGSSCFWAFHCFAMDSKELSSISDYFGD